MDPISQELQSLVNQTLPLLRAVRDERAAFIPALGAWSTKQVLGHLVDSAANNHTRFVQARFSQDLVFPTYDQEGWVLAQAYQDAAWQDLLDLWSAYNLHLARVIALIPLEARSRPRLRHNLDRIAWQPVPAGAPVTLEYLMADYVAHLKNHLRQIFDLLDLPRTAWIA